MDGPRELVAIDLSYDRNYPATQSQPEPQVWDVTVSLDPSANYLIRRLQLTCTTKSDKRRVRRDTEVTRFVEAAPGVFFPDLVEFRVDINGQRTYTDSVRITDLRINQPIAPGKLRLAYDQGVRVLDSIRGSEYQVDADGRRITPEIRQPKANLPPAITPSNGSKTVVPRTETKEEPRSAVRWILPSSLIVLSAGILLAFVRRWRAPANGD
jgi:hypothetical protein